MFQFSGVLVTVPGLNIGDVPEKLYNGMTQKCTSVLSLMGGAASRGYAKAHLDTLTSSARAFLRARIPIPFQIIHSAILLGTCRDTLLLKVRFCLWTLSERLDPSGRPVCCKLQ